jgi:DNA-binding transcriptional ArsR family regulator
VGVGEISNKIIISQSSPQSVSEFVAAMGTQAQIEELLKEGSKTTSEIEEAVGITNANARNALKRLKDKNKITKLGDGKWGLLALNY